MSKSDIPRHWKPLVPMAQPEPTEMDIQNHMKLSGLTRDGILAEIARHQKDTETWRNDLYQVQLRKLTHGFVHINIRRNDGRADLRDWRHFQQIKNQLVGDECEAMEIYPAESRKVDTSNKFHLWASTDPSFRFPVNVFDKRDVSYESGSTPGTRQRSL